MKRQEVRENSVVGDFYTDFPRHQQKTIIMLGGSEGGKSWSRIRKPIAYLVNKGYAVLSLAYFKEKGLPDSLEEIPLEYFAKAFQWLSEQKTVIGNQYAILGGSKGAEAGLILASRYPQIKAVIALSPSSVVWQGIPRKRFELGKDVKSSWTYHGEELPFLTYPHPIKKLDLYLLRLRGIHEQVLRDSNGVGAAAIQAEKIQGAILLISGNEDRMWPATQMSEMITDRLKTNNFKYHFEHQAYDAGHNGILMNRACWRKIGAFLDKNLP